jgi:hypothetical protein
MLLSVGFFESKSTLKKITLYTLANKTLASKASRGFSQSLSFYFFFLVKVTTGIQMLVLQQSAKKTRQAAKGCPAKGCPALFFV